MDDLELIKKYVPKESQNDAIKKLNSGYPIQYIIGNVDFFGNIIEVNENVLIPRFETEYLIEKTLNYLKKLNISSSKVLEIGTGSGCISITLKKIINCNVTAIDISAKALSVAKKNAINNNVHIDFIEKDINDFNTNDKYDLIISNPPYVPIGNEVDKKTKYEPQNAIFAPENGLYFYRIILEKIKNNLNKNYLIAFEIGDKEGEYISEFIKIYLPNSYIKVEKDYNNYERYVFISNMNLN